MSNRKFKIIVIDNDNDTRNSLVNKLKQHPDFIISAEAPDASTAIEKIILYKPDLIFLLIEMPNKNAFAILDELKRINQPDFEVI